MQNLDVEGVVGLVSPDRILALEQAMIRIPSATFHEGPLADFLAGYLTELGLDVEVMDVRHGGNTTRQTIARLRGAGAGPTLMLNGHMDPVVSMSGWSVDPLAAKYENGWIWGAGAHDDKGGLAAAIGAVDAIVRSGAKLKGDILVCAVASHKAGGIGTKALLAAGIRADMCINMEHAANSIATVVTGQMRVKLICRSPGLFFRYRPEAKAAYFNPIEQLAVLVQRLGPSLDGHQPGSWLSFAPHPDLPGFPKHRFDRVAKDHYERECTLHMQIRTVPGQTPESVREDLERVVADIRKDHPTFDCAVIVPADGLEDVHLVPPSEIARDHPLTTALADGMRRATGREPELGGALRIGNTGDGNFLAAAGIPTLQFGPGDIRIYPEWPAPDERVELRELVEAAKAIAYAACRVCG